MSDNWIVLIPEDPHVVPTVDRRDRAKARFAELAPLADEIESVVEEVVQFVDCGGNFERIECPSCRAEIPIEWWQERVDQDFDGRGFHLSAYDTPCCSVRHTLHDLIYDWPQGFARYSLRAMNPELGTLRDEVKREFEAILGTRLRIIYRHL